MGRPGYDPADVWKPQRNAAIYATFTSFLRQAEPPSHPRHTFDDPRTEALRNIQNEGFENLIRGSRVTMENVLRRAPSTWYIEAHQAQALGLVEAVLWVFDPRERIVRSRPEGDTLWSIRIV